MFRSSERGLTCFVFISLVRALGQRLLKGSESLLVGTHGGPVVFLADPALDDALLRVLQLLQRGLAVLVPLRLVFAGQKLEKCKKDWLRDTFQDRILKQKLTLGQIFKD